MYTALPGKGILLETSAFDYHLPDSLIAQHPVEPRDHSRLMVVRRENGGSIEHRRFFELPELLNPGDVLVRNNTQVVAARLIGRREATGGNWEGLFLRELDGGDWEILGTTRGKPLPGEGVIVGSDLRLTLIEKGEGGRWRVRPEGSESAESLLERHGQVPLPPYIRKGREESGDRLRYQTVYAKKPGAVAAPTAGLHFTDPLFQRLRDRSVATVDVTLHVGIGTFRPIEAERIEDHVLHAEWGELTAENARTLREGKANGSRIIGVGTTSARVLETAARETGTIQPFAGETALYLRPGHEFRGIDALITNFHLPKSSLLVLVSALASLKLIRQAYDEAIRHEYRFYSYGDAMLIL